jgi:hypothetical protein
MQDIKKGGMPIICQLFSYIPDFIIDQSVNEFESDKYYKRLKTKQQLLFMFYGVVGKLESLNGLIKSLTFFGKTLNYLGISQLPGRSTLADANKNRESKVFGKIYTLLVDYYKQQLNGSYLTGYIDKLVDINKVKIFDSTTFTLFVDIFTGAGRNKITGKKKGGIKAHVLLSLHSLVPDIVWMSAASKNDKDFLGQLKPASGEIYIFDKGYVNYNVYQNWTELGVFYVTRLNDNGKYEVLSVKEISYQDSLLNGILKDEIISLKTDNSPMKARLVTFKALSTGKVYTFLTNMFEVEATTVAKLYKNRWEIEPFFKQLKQNFELKAFYSDSPEGIKTQIWIAMIANLIFTVIHRQTKQTEAFTTMVQMARMHQASYIKYIEVIKKTYWRAEERILEKMQYNLFNYNEGGVFENTG